MSSMIEHFNNDFGAYIGLGQDMEFKNQVNGESIKINAQIRHDLPSSIRFFTFYIPECNNPIEVIHGIIENLDKLIPVSDEIEAIGGFLEDFAVGTHLISFSNRIYIYFNGYINHSITSNLNEYAQAKNIYITIRDLKYAEKKMELQNPIAFISHDSRDKDLIARPLALSLNSRLCFVWYDEFSLKVGDSLRGSIERGIKDAKKCIIVLTKNFLSNPGWTKTEFDSIFTRERIFNERIILPIWYGVTKEEVYDYSPSLVDCFGLTWPSAENKTKEQYDEEVQLLVSKLHAAVKS